MTATVTTTMTGCAYDPPMQADHASPAYKANLHACRETAHKEADRIVKARGLLFLTYPVSLLIVRRIQLRKCMQGKGYKLEG
jgi:hypothetical protein